MAPKKLSEGSVSGKRGLWRAWNLLEVK
jgi:hypothetical protein